MAFTVAEVARRWGVSERTVRAYCAEGRIPGAELIGKTWAVPEDAEKPARRPRSSSRKRTLLEALREEKASGMTGGIYHHVQIELTYNSNHIEGSRLSHEQTRFIFETNTIGVADSVRVDDIVEAVNHFRCIDMVIDAANRRLSERMIKGLHAQLKQGTTDSRKSWFAVGDYKRLPNEVGGRKTTDPEHVARDMSRLVAEYEAKQVKTFEDVVAFHAAFEAIHPFQDGNGRIGRLVMFKECLRNGITPFIITDEVKLFYYRGLSQWNHEPGYLLDTCRAAQDAFGELLERFRIELPAG